MDIANLLNAGEATHNQLQQSAAVMLFKLSGL
jgi:hypothetical protein